MALTKFLTRLGLKLIDLNSPTRGRFTLCFTYHYSRNGMQARCCKFLVISNLLTQTNQNISKWKKYYGGDGIRRPANDNVNSSSYGKGIPLKMQNGSLLPFLPTKPLYKLTSETTLFQKLPKFHPVTEDSNSS